MRLFWESGSLDFHFKLFQDLCQDMGDGVSRYLPVPCVVLLVKLPFPGARCASLESFWKSSLIILDHFWSFWITFDHFGSFLNHYWIILAGEFPQMSQWPKVTKQPSPSRVVAGPVGLPPRRGTRGTATGSLDAAAAEAAGGIGQCGRGARWSLDWGGLAGSFSEKWWLCPKFRSQNCQNHRFLFQLQ